jgi:inner membrane transporter RhtA
VRAGGDPVVVVLVVQQRLTGAPLAYAVAAGVLASAVPYAADLLHEWAGVVVVVLANVVAVLHASPAPRPTEVHSPATAA